MTEGAQGAAAASAPRAMPNNVKFGPYSQPGNHVGKTVAQVRTEHMKLWEVPKDASAFNGKVKLTDDHIIQAGENIQFHKVSGEKGVKGY